MSKHARLTSWVISSHDWASPAGTPSLSQREPRTARARALKTSVPLRRELPSEQATNLVRRQRQPAEQILARRVPPRARAPPVLRRLPVSAFPSASNDATDGVCFDV